MKLCLLITLTLLVKEFQGQTSSLLNYQNEINRIKRLSEINVNSNSGEVCRDDSTKFFLGVLILAKNSNQSTKVSFISLDSNVNKSFKVHPNYPINVNWAVVEPEYDSAYVIQKYLFGCPTEKKFSSTDFLEETMKFENTLIELWRGKVIELKPFTGLVGYPRR